MPVASVPSIKSYVHLRVLGAEGLLELTLTLTLTLTLALALTCGCSAPRVFSKMASAETYSGTAIAGEPCSR